MNTTQNRQLPQDNSDKEPVIRCRECAFGRLHRKYVTYFTWMGEELITVPDFPALVCDSCGWRQYDGNAVNRLAVLLNPVFNQSTEKTKHLPRANNEATQQRPPGVE